MNREELISSVFHPSGHKEAIGRERFGNEPIQQLAKKLFNLPDGCLFSQIPTSEDCDPRGFIDLYGEDPEMRYELNDGKSGFVYHALACFFDHISFILDDETDCILTPTRNGIEFMFFNQEEDSAITVMLIKSRSDLVSTIADLCTREAEST